LSYLLYNKYIWAEDSEILLYQIFARGGVRMEKNLVVLIAVLLLFVFLETKEVFSAEKGEKGASTQAYEHASENAIFNRVSDWFTTIGKSKEEKEAIIAERKTKRATRRAEKEVQKAARKAERERERERKVEEGAEKFKDKVRGQEKGKK